MVCVSSSNIALVELDLDDLMMEKKVKTGDSGKEPYSVSKLANSICVYKFASTLEDNAGVKIVQLCPGYVKTDVFRSERGIIKFIRNSLSLGAIGLTPHQVIKNDLYFIYYIYNFLQSV